MCKPHKRGMSNRWKPKLLQDLKITEKELQNVRKGGY